MIKKFECWDCEKHFLADDDIDNVVCPHCGSDNVEYATWHMPCWFGKVLAGIVFFILFSYGLYKLISNSIHSQPQSNVEEIVKETSDEYGITEDSTSIDVSNQPPILSLTNLVYKDDSGYEFTIKVIFPPQESYKVLLLDAFEDKIIQESDNGIFEAIPYSKNHDGYRVALVAESDENKFISITPITGFVKQVKVEKKMTIDMAQELLDKRDNSLLGAGENDYISPTLKLDFIGLSSDAINIPTKLADVIIKLDDELWQSATITKLEYDDKNRICRMTIKVIEADEW